MTPSVYCPWHGTEQRLCSQWCFEARAQFVMASADLETYWIMRYGREKAAAPRITQRYEQAIAGHWRVVRDVA